MAEYFRIRRSGLSVSELTSGNAVGNACSAWQSCRCCAVVAKCFNLGDVIMECNSCISGVLLWFGIILNWMVWSRDVLLVLVFVPFFKTHALRSSFFVRLADEFDLILLVSFTEMMNYVSTVLHSQEVASRL